MMFDEFPSVVGDDEKIKDMRLERLSGDPLVAELPTSRSSTKPAALECEMPSANSEKLATHSSAPGKSHRILSSLPVVFEML